MTRSVEPEILDELPADHPLAVASRKDLRRINNWMGHVRTMARNLERQFESGRPKTIVELGASDGCFLAALSSRMGSDWKGTSAILLDRNSCLAVNAARKLKQNCWNVSSIQGDVFDWVREPNPQRVELVMCNLFLHHFLEANLKVLLEGIARRTNVFICLEPRRSRLGLLASRLVGLIGCNRVTRHDAPVSVRAGFNGKDLSSLWPKEAAWMLEEKQAGWCSHLFIASRRS
jgi:hypothetical protein